MATSETTPEEPAPEEETSTAATATGPAPLSETGPQKGQWYRLIADFGEGVGMLTKTWRYASPTGVEYPDNPRTVLVLQVVEPAASGVGYSPEDTVLCLWIRTSRPGRLSAHHLSLPVTQFLEVFEDGVEPPEWADWQAQMQAGG
jgi:hypothetical protein